MSIIILLHRIHTGRFFDIDEDAGHTSPRLSIGIQLVVLVEGATFVYQGWQRRRFTSGTTTGSWNTVIATTTDVRFIQIIDTDLTFYDCVYGTYAYGQGEEYS
jgi:hypothetical protein